jgi:hypothetical protein
MVEMSTGERWDQESATTQGKVGPSSLGLTLGLAALAAVGAALTIQQIMSRRLSKPEVARLKFYRYLRERGHLDS